MIIYCWSCNVGVYIVGSNIVLSHTFINLKCEALPNMSDGVCETVGEEEVGWQPISAISLQQSFQI